MDAEKARKVQSFRNFLQYNGIDYQEKANGHFQIFKNGKLIYQTWATTAKMVDNPSDLSQQQSWTGEASITTTLLSLCEIKEVKDTPPWDTEVVQPSKSNAVRENFKTDVNYLKVHDIRPSVMVAVVKLPTGAYETIVNSNHIESKCEYYLKAYDEEFKLKTNPEVSIVGIMIF
jgi:hypothetical protein